MVVKFFWSQIIGVITLRVATNMNVVWFLGTKLRSNVGEKNCSKFPQWWYKDFLSKSPDSRTIFNKCDILIGTLKLQIQVLYSFMDYFFKIRQSNTFLPIFGFEKYFFRTHKFIFINNAIFCIFPSYFRLRFSKLRYNAGERQLTLYFIRTGCKRSERCYMLPYRKKNENIPQGKKLSRV